MPSPVETTEAFACPPQYSFQNLLRQPGGSVVDKIIYGLRHRSAHVHFEKNRRIPQKSLGETFPGLADTRATIRAAVPSETAVSNLTIHELVALSTLCAYCQPKNAFEFGTPATAIIPTASRSTTIQIGISRETSSSQTSPVWIMSWRTEPSRSSRGHTISFTIIGDLPRTREGLWQRSGLLFSLSLRHFDSQE